MKLIGLELRVGMDQFRDIEVLVVPVNIVFPFPFAYPYGPKANVTLHTSMGDVGAVFPLSSGVALEPYRGNLTFGEIQAKYDALRAQIEKG